MTSTTWMLLDYLSPSKASELAAKLLTHAPYRANMRKHLEMVAKELEEEHLKYQQRYFQDKPTPDDAWSPNA